MSNPLAVAPKPGYLTSEFWSTLLVHALATVATLLDLLHVNWAHGLSATQATVPMVAIIVSAVLQAAYHDKRTAVKIDHAAQLARTYVAELENGYHEIEPAAEPVIQYVTNVTHAAPGYAVNTAALGVTPSPAPVEAAPAPVEATPAPVLEGDAAP